METRPLIVVTALVLGSGVAMWAARAQGTGVTRTELQRHDLDVPGREAVQARIDFAPGAVAGSHTHPGEEVIYVLAGSLEYEVEGRPPVTLEAGGVLFIPTRTIHAAKNVGGVEATELATYVVEKGQPLVTPASSRQRAPRP